MNTTEQKTGWPPGMKTLPLSLFVSRIENGVICTSIEVPYTPENWAGMGTIGRLNALPLPGRTSDASASAAPKAQAGRKATTGNVSETLLKTPAPPKQTSRGKRAGTTAQAEGQKETAVA